MLSFRYVTFYKSLISSTNLSVKLLARLCEKDMRTVLGRTLDSLCTQCHVADLSLLSSKCVKTTMKYSCIPEDEEWRDQAVNELLMLRNESLSLPGFSMDEIKKMMDFVCTS